MTLDNVGGRWNHRIIESSELPTQNLRKICWDGVREDMQSFGLTLEDAEDRNEWRRKVKGQLAKAQFPFKRNRLRFLRFSFTQRTQRKRLRLNGNRA